MGKRSRKKAQEAAPVPSAPPLWEKRSVWVSMILLILLLTVFFYPVLLGSRSFQPPDQMASRSFQPFVDEALGKGEYPLWNPYIFGGMPSFASLSRAPYVDVASLILNTAIRVLSFGQVDPNLHFARYWVNTLLLGVSMFLLLRSRRLSSYSALYGSLAMVFMPQVVVYSAFGHSSMLNTVAMIPLVFLLTDRLLEKRNLLFFSLTGLAVGVQLLRAHTQICYYTYMLIGLYFLFWAGSMIKEKQLSGAVKGGLLLAGALIMGLLVSAVLNVSVWEYARYSLRGGGETGGLAYDYATNWSFPPSEITTFFIPSFMGFGRDTYWGPMPFTDFPLYFGLVTFVLAILALTLQRNRTTLFLAIFGALAVVISFGRHFPVLYGFLFRFLPFFDKFRVPKMIHIVFEFGMVFLAACGIEGLMQSAGEKKANAVRRLLLIFGGAIVLLTLVLILGKNAYLGWSGSRIGELGIRAHDKALFDAYRALILFAVTAGAVWLTVKGKLQKKVFPFVVILLLLIDVWPVNRRFMEHRPRTEERGFFAATPEVEFLKNQEKPFRILPIADSKPANWYMYHLLQNVWGYQGAKLRIFQETADAFGIPNNLIQPYITQENGRYRFRTLEEMDPGELAVHDALLKLMNVRYLISPYRIPNPKFKTLLQPDDRGGNGVMEYTDFLPRVFFPREILQGKGKEGILALMTSGRFDPARTAILEEEPPEIGDPDGNEASVVSYEDHRIEIQAMVKSPSLMVISEIYYPAGWKAYVDGQETRILKTNHLLRSVLLEPGTHTVEFRFRPGSFRIGLLVSVCSLSVLVLGAAAGFLFGRRKRNA